MTDTIVGIVGLVITILGVPCALAFTFSSAYKKVIAYVLIAVLFMLFLFALTWTGGVLFADYNLRGHVNENAKSALERIDFWKLSFSSAFVLFGGFAVASIWVFALRFVDDLKKYEVRLQDDKDAAAAKQKHLEWHAATALPAGKHAPIANTSQVGKTQSHVDRK